MTLSNAEIDHLSAEDYYREFRSIWSGTEIKLTEDVSAFRKGKGKCLMILISGCHGDERSGPIALYQFAKKLANLKINGSIYIVPIINPHAWNVRKRSPNRLNMNRIWNKTRSKRAIQIKKIMNLLKRKNPLIFGDLHEDEVIKDNQHYLFRFHDSEFCKQLQVEMETSPRKGISFKHDGQTSESYAHSIGIINSFTSESCPFFHIDERVSFQEKILNYCLKWTNNKENWEVLAEAA